MSDEAERQLEDTYKTMVKGRKSESAYKVHMALVAILIFQGKYQEAAQGRGRSISKYKLRRCSLGLKL
ncbi:hypothetical protein C1H46_026337 [Malus baccata]|uniref:Uncharacterized protein n=1 Tax=Malus baccata TaxID=106549 RepID=A0A540LNR8_MALBA|nr:hypothetical protein C1H46_026337 [Malus baccata]